MLRNAGITKPILVLLLGGLPLATLTLASFAGVGDLDLTLPSPQDGEGVPAAASIPVPSAQQLSADDLLCTTVAEREFLAGEPLPEHALQADPLYWDSLIPDWKRWAHATELVGDVMRVKEDLVDTVDRNESAIEQIDANAKKLESAVERIGEIQDACRKANLAGSARLHSILDSWSRELQDEIASLRKRKDALNTMDQAKNAYMAGNFSTCVDLYKKLLPDYAGSLRPDELTFAQRQRKAAAFRDGAKRLLDDVKKTEDAETRQGLLQTFVDNYPASERIGSTEQEIARQINDQLELARREVKQIELNREARQPIAALDRYDARVFAEGLAEAARIAETYPTDWVRIQLQQRVALWISNALPLKQLEEPVDLEEVATTSDTILRGFFEPVPDAGGNVIGYKRYTTATERLNPTRIVGRYPAADLRGVPSVSVPRQCVTSYVAARARVLADPATQAYWDTLRRLCDGLEVQLIEYRRKPGSSPESLSFNRESQFAKAVQTPAAWSQMEAIWGK